MRLLILSLLIGFLPITAFSQIEARNFPNMPVYVQSDSGSYIEVFYSGSSKKLEQNLTTLFLDSSDGEARVERSKTLTVYGPLYKPVFTGSSYYLRQEVIGLSKQGQMLRFRIQEKLGPFNLLDARLGAFRTVMAKIQEAVDASLKMTYYQEDQAPNTMYLFEPKDLNKNLASYLFCYSKDPIDSSMKKLTEWYVLACEKPQVGSWIDDNTFRIDNLRQPAFGSNDVYSLTIEHSIVQDGYHQYVFYLSNYKHGDEENNYEVRPHDIHIRLWHYYNQLLFIEKRAR